MMVLPSKPWPRPLMDRFSAKDLTDPIREALEQFPPGDIDRECAMASLKKIIAILDDEPAEREAEGPQIGDWVAVRFNGVLSRKSWTAMVWDEECSDGTEWFEEVRIIERAAEIKRRIEEAKE